MRHSKWQGKQPTGARRATAESPASGRPTQMAIKVGIESTGSLYTNGTEEVRAQRLIFGEREA